MKLRNLVVLACVCGQLGCGPKGAPGLENSVTKTGECTARFVDDYNSVGFSTNFAASLSNNSALGASYALDSLNRAKGSCNRFLETHGKVGSCRALVNGVSKPLLVLDVRSACNGVDEALAKLAPPPVPVLPDLSQIALPDDAILWSQLQPTQVKIKIVNLEKFLEQGRAGRTSALANGVPLSPAQVRSLGNPNLVYCVINSDQAPGFTGLSANQELVADDVFVHVSGSKKASVIVFHDNSINIVCGGPDNLDLTLKHLRDALHNILEISLVP